MTAKLGDLRRRLPVGDRAEYERAYAEAELAARVGELVHRLREQTGTSVAALALAAGVEEEEILHVEEGGMDVTLAFLDRLGRALRAGMTLAATLRPGDAAVQAGPSGAAGTVSFGAPPAQALPAADARAPRR